ncbi:MAG: hypothetical protein HAW65_04280 [Alphaproteobacteria bacterium]|nr:hypothetical protein [Alphaproteobacteria bacterium]
MTFYIWLTGLTLYALFIAWYHNWRGALRETEIDAYTTQLKTRPNTDDKTRDLLQKFMREDKGREFLMLNLLQFHGGDVAHPITGEDIRPSHLLQEYFKPFIGRMLLRAGHPALTGIIRAGYIEAWGVEENHGWQAAGIIRYRSRRDMMKAICDETFSDIHVFKHAALAHTLAMPMERTAPLFSPRLSVAVVLVAVCACLHILVGGV